MQQSIKMAAMAREVKANTVRTYFCSKFKRVWCIVLTFVVKCRVDNLDVCYSDTFLPHPLLIGYEYRTKSDMISKSKSCP